MTQVFSGCGMSKAVADLIGDIPNSLGFVMPVYGWRIPKAVRTKLQSLDFRTRNLSGEKQFTWAVFTCGDDVGYIDRDLERVLGRKLDAAYSVVMPDTYLGLPGFQLDSPEESAAKLAAARARTLAIRERLLSREFTRDLKRGPFPWVKTAVIGPVFEKLLVKDSFWRLDREKCVKCGKCAAECPVGDIEIGADGYPRWKGDGSCSGCFRCYHFCSGDAIEFGRMTRGKGRLAERSVI